MIAVLTTCKDRKDAERIAQGLLKARLAACVNMFPVTSHYLWKGALHKETEFQLIAKTSKKFPEIEQAIKALHSYQVPEIIAFDVKHTSQSYMTWMKKELA